MILPRQNLRLDFHYQRDFVDTPTVHGYVLKKLRPVGCSLVFCYLGHPSACRRFTGHKDIANATTFALVVEPLRILWSSRKRRARFPNQLARRLGPRIPQEMRHYKGVGMRREPAPSPRSKCRFSSAELLGSPSSRT